MPAIQTISNFSDRILTMMHDYNISMHDALCDDMDSDWNIERYDFERAVNQYLDINLPSDDNSKILFRDILLQKENDYMLIK